MGLEIERKFLLKNSDWEQLIERKIAIQQGYLNADAARTVRIRITNETAFLTIKGKTEKISRQEFEYEIPVEDAASLLQLCKKPLIKKTRFIIPHQGHIWEIDTFKGDNEGLILAEIELNHQEEAFVQPSWIGEEVSHDPRYYNASLIKHPFKDWE